MGKKQCSIGTNSKRRKKSESSGNFAVCKTDEVPPALRLDPLHTILHVKHLHDELIYSLPFFLSRVECQRVRSFADQTGFERVTQRASRNYAFRDNDRLLLRLPAFAELLWTRLQPHVVRSYEGMHAVGLNPAIRFYRYNAGQRFGCHVDQSDVDRITGYHSRFTVLVYLNDSTDSELQGGHTIFYANEAGEKEEVVLSVTPMTGLALVHGHGDRCLLHEGARVTRGAKYVLRTDVMYSRTKP
ncbi:2-oxoglutarate and fe-dependent oxygenase superfamily protein isoform 1 [Plasmopara halstedii]|uniref:2-oxoglutarate and fe-dependent oxygenase superfamily protein isoform 1 n=1 Tax=Plasmopara halstedii TaxID=4781 RepID=A0A0P1B1D8_PLAHL|nr:2-oxoglutarate and fe-dependent oxygenase superfamily protein isoform 1 [Plasmopara halstedii]CEG48014.1 2-oxoglutarate and fe-dependent oxygenase superfamily protein isoform 1 [Plasmopara halstedii]|eukprot:XP_024584383.1 2-oxoglutarate and fe-dependent oxygenase superfamily protein isoform 1 [Plasmopara halstedii]